MTRTFVLGIVALVAAMGTTAACADEEIAEEPFAGPGEACFSNADCMNDACIVSPDGSRACAGGDQEAGGW